MDTHTYRLTDDTVGTCGGLIVDIGDRVTVHLHDENGLPIEKIGIVAEVLE